MGHRLKEIHRELTKLKRLGLKGRKKFIKACSKECVTNICECIKNVLNTKLPIKASHLKKLSRFKHTLRTLASKRTSLINRRRLLQKGGFLPALLTSAIPAIASLISGLFNGQTNDNSG
jgi:hypothetical protein